MKFVVKYGATISRLSSVALVALVGAAIAVSAQQYQQQHNDFVASQSLTVQRYFAAIQNRLHVHLEEHDVQRQLMEMRVSSLQGCVTPEQQAGLQAVLAIKTAGVKDVTVQLRQLSRAQAAELAPEQFLLPQPTHEPQGLVLTSMQPYGQTCGSGAVLLQVTRTLLGTSFARTLWEGNDVPDFSFTLLRKQVVLLHLNLSTDPRSDGTIPTRALPLNDPLVAELLQASTTAEAHGTVHFFAFQGRAAALLQEPAFGLQMLYYTPVLASDFLSLFLRHNATHIVWLLSLLASLLLVRVFIGHLVAVSKEYYEASTFDFLTSLFNRRAAMHLLESEVARASRSGRALCVMQLDIDFFKQVNDQHGHDGGDQVLKMFAQVLSSSLRQGDVAARIGGEEFLLVLPDTDLAGAKIFAERLLMQVREAHLDYRGTCIKITCSLGIAGWRGPQDSLQGILIRADALLYQAKQQGRDRAIAEAPSSVTDDSPA